MLEMLLRSMISFVSVELQHILASLYTSSMVALMLDFKLSCFLILNGMMKWLVRLLAKVAVWSSP